MGQDFGSIALTLVGVYFCILVLEALGSLIRDKWEKQWEAEGLDEFAPYSEPFESVIAEDEIYYFQKSEVELEKHLQN